MGVPAGDGNEAALLLELSDALRKPPLVLQGRKEVLERIARPGTELPDLRPNPSPLNAMYLC